MSNEQTRPLVDGVTPPVKEQYLDKDKLMRMLPTNCKHVITDELIAHIKRIEDDAGILQEYAEESILSHLGILNDVKCTMQEYVDAVKFVALTNAGMSNAKAYEIVFPDRVKKIIERTGSMNTSWSSQYNQNSLVTKLRVAMYTPVQITHKPLEAHAVNVLYMLSNGYSPVEGQKVSPSVIKDSAIGILNYFKEEANKGPTINIGLNTQESAEERKKDILDTLREIAKGQSDKLKNGEDIVDVQVLGIGTGDDE